MAYDRMGLVALCISAADDDLAAAEKLASGEPLAGETLTPYGVAYRSIEPLDPDREEFEEALTFAYAVHDYVSGRMPEVG